MAPDIELNQASAFSAFSYSRVKPLFHYWKANRNIKWHATGGYWKTAIFTSVVYGK
jgi:hypothetical protein